MPTCIEVLGTATARPRWRLSAGALSPRVVASGPGWVRIGLLATTALLLAGDEVSLSIDVSGPVRVSVFEVAGTVAYDMRGGSATWSTSITLSGGASLSLESEPFVVASGACVTRSLTLDAAAGCTASLREPLVLGRSGEDGGALTSRTRLSYDGALLLTETLRLDPAYRSSWAILGPHRCLDTLTTVGHRLPGGPGVVQLEGRGSLQRSLTAHLHESRIPPNCGGGDRRFSGGSYAS